jgi:hypothetical protein
MICYLIENNVTINRINIKNLKLILSSNTAINVFVIVQLRYEDDVDDCALQQPQQFSKFATKVQQSADPLFNEKFTYEFLSLTASSPLRLHIEIWFASNMHLLELELDNFSHDHFLPSINVIHNA